MFAALLRPLSIRNRILTQIEVDDSGFLRVPPRILGIIRDKVPSSFLVLSDEVQGSNKLASRIHPLIIRVLFCLCILPLIGSATGIELYFSVLLVIVAIGCMDKGRR